MKPIRHAPLRATVRSPGTTLQVGRSPTVTIMPMADADEERAWDEIMLAKAA